MTSSPRRRAVGRRGATTLTLLGAALAQGQGLAAATPADVPLAECHDLAVTFDHVTSSSYDVVVTAVVTQPGIFALGESHAYFGTSDSVPDPDGVPMTSTATIIGVDPGTDVPWTASCVGDSTSATVHVPDAPVPPTVRLSGDRTVRADQHSSVRSPVTATAVDSRGRAVAVRCTPAVLPVVPSRTTVTCTTAPDSAGRVGRASRVVTVLGAAAQLDQLRAGLPAGHLRNLVASTHDAVVLRDGPASARRLGLVLDELPHAGLGARRSADVRADVQRIARVLGVTVPLVHQVRRGDTVWSVVTDALRAKTGSVPGDTAVARGVRLVLAVNKNALDRYGVLHVGTVLTLPL